MDPDSRDGIPASLRRPVLALRGKSEAQAMMIVKTHIMHDARPTRERHDRVTDEIALGTMQPIHDVDHGAFIDVAHCDSSLIRLVIQLCRASRGKRENGLFA
jgi:hypothetical protein